MRAMLLAAPSSGAVAQDGCVCVQANVAKFDHEDHEGLVKMLLAELFASVQTNVISDIPTMRACGKMSSSGM